MTTYSVPESSELRMLRTRLEVAEKRLASARAAGNALRVSAPPSAVRAATERTRDAMALVNRLRGELNESVAGDMLRRVTLEALPRFAAYVGADPKLVMAGSRGLAERVALGWLTWWTVSARNVEIVSLATMLPPALVRAALRAFEREMERNPELAAKAKRMRGDGEARAA